MGNIGEHQAVSSDRQFDLAKTAITILVSLVMVAGGGWLAAVSARASEAQTEARAAALVAAEARTKAESALAQGNIILASIVELKRDMNAQMSALGAKIDALYVPIGKRR